MRPSISPLIWEIGLDAWVIQDGNYPDFTVGQVAEFALELWIPKVSFLTHGEEVSALYLGEGRYQTIAEVVLQTEDITILDIGILVYRESARLTKSLTQGGRFALQFGLSVDPFFYFERLSKIAGVPPLVYSWKIISILRQTASLIETVAQSGALAGRKVLIRDPAQLGYEEVARTDAWKDDGEYLLRCELLSITPKRASPTALR